MCFKAETYKRLILLLACNVCILLTKHLKLALVKNNKDISNQKYTVSQLLDITKRLGTAVGESVARTSKDHPRLLC